MALGLMPTYTHWATATCPHQTFDHCHASTSLIALIGPSSRLTARRSRTSVRRCLETTPRAPNASGSVRPNPPDQRSLGSNAYGFYTESSRNVKITLDSVRCSQLNQALESRAPEPSLQCTHWTSGWGSDALASHSPEPPQPLYIARVSRRTQAPWADALLA
jgi:hypothetical protein